MKKKHGIAIACFIVVLVILVAIVMIFNRQNAKGAIHDYMLKQGIKQNQLEYADFSRDYKRGGYFLNVHVKGEKPDIYYEYSFVDKKVSFQAYLNPENAIKEKKWGGSGLSSSEMEKIKYPPLK